MCVCVCERERESVREREKVKERELKKIVKQVRGGKRGTDRRNGQDIN